MPTRTHKYIDHHLPPSFVFRIIVPTKMVPGQTDTNLYTVVPISLDPFMNPFEVL